MDNISISETLGHLTSLSRHKALQPSPGPFHTFTPLSGCLLGQVPELPTPAPVTPDAGGGGRLLARGGAKKQEKQFMTRGWSPEQKSGA